MQSGGSTGRHGARLVHVLRSPALRRIELGFGGFSVMENATWLAITIYAFDRGGAGTVALAMVLQLVPAVVASPFAAAAGDRFSPQHALRVGYVAQSTALAGTALALAADAELWVYVCAAATATSFTFTRPVIGALLPHHARTDDDLVAANVVTGCLENLGVFVGPALAGLVLDQASGAFLFWVGAATMAACAVTAPSTKPTLRAEREAKAEAGKRADRRASGPRHEAARADMPPATAATGTVAAADVAQGVLAGFRMIHRLRDVRVLVGLLTCAGLLAGVGDVLVVTFAEIRLSADDGTIGVLAAALGLGGIVGSLSVSGLRPGRSTCAYLAASVVLAVGALAVLSATGQPVLATGAFLATGSAESILRVTSNVTVQQLAPAAVRARILGVVESLQLAGLAVGALAAAAAVEVLGLRNGVLVLALAVGVIVTVGVVRLRSACVARPRRAPSVDRVEDRAAEQTGDGVDRPPVLVR